MSDYASVCVLSFNRVGLLAQTIASMIAHAGHPMELIIHDDGSSNDGIQHYLAGLIDTGLASTVILNRSGHNQGQGTALNRMFGMASGDPILKMDQDLLFEPNWLRRAVDLLDENKRRSDAQAEPRIGLLGLLHYAYDPVDSLKTIQADYGYWSAHTHILGSAFAMPREAWETLGPFEEHSPAFAEDYGMQMKVTESGEAVCALPPESLCENIGMGYGPSTVNVAPGQVQTIHGGPYIVRP